MVARIADSTTAADCIGKTHVDRKFGDQGNIDSIMLALGRFLVKLLSKLTQLQWRRQDLVRGLGARN